MSLSHALLCLVTAARQAPLSMGFSRQEYWSGFPCPPPGDFPNPGIKPAPLMSPALAGGFLPLVPPEKPLIKLKIYRTKGFPDSSTGKESTCKAGKPGSVPGSGRSSGEGIGYPLRYSWAFLVARLVKNLHLGSIPGLGRSPGGGHGNPLQYSCLENPMDRGAWWATVHGVTKSWAQLSDLTYYA